MYRSHCPDFTYLVTPGSVPSPRPTLHLLVRSYTWLNSSSSSITTMNSQTREPKASAVVEKEAELKERKKKLQQEVSQCDNNNNGIGHLVTVQYH